MPWVIRRNRDGLFWARAEVRDRMRKESQATSYMVYGYTPNLAEAYLVRRVHDASKLCSPWETAMTVEEVLYTTDYLSHALLHGWGIPANINDE